MRQAPRTPPHPPTDADAPPRPPCGLWVVGALIFFDVSICFRMVSRVSVGSDRIAEIDRNTEIGRICRIDRSGQGDQIRQVGRIGWVCQIDRIVGLVGSIGSVASLGSVGWVGSIGILLDFLRF